MQFFYPIMQFFCAIMQFFSLLNLLKDRLIKKPAPIMGRAFQIEAFRVAKGF